MITSQRPRLSFWQIWNMCFGFLGVQVGMGLQLANMSPIYRYLGADESKLPLLWLAGPITGLIIQPIIGEMGDNTWGRWGKRRPYFLVGAIIASIGLVLMPYSNAVWIAAGLMWIIDASVNTTMESFRALVGDILPTGQRASGFTMQAFMIGVGQLFSSASPFMLTLFGFSALSSANTVPDFVKYAFVLGAIIILGSILYTSLTTKEYPPDDMDAFLKRKAETGGLAHSIREIFRAVGDMPLTMRQIWWVKLFTWYALPLMWQFLSLSIARHVYDAQSTASPGFSRGVEMGGVAAAFFSAASICMSFLFPFLIRQIGLRKIYFYCLLIGATGFIAMHSAKTIGVVFALSFVMGIGFSSMHTIPYIMVSKTVPSERMGVYMGIMNAFVCIPQIVGMLTVPLFYDSLLGGDPRNALLLAGILFGIAAVLSLRITSQVDQAQPVVSDVTPSLAH